MATRRKVLVIEPIHEAGISLLGARGDVDVTTTTDISEPALIEAVRDVHGIIVRTAAITRKVVDAAPLLEVVSRHGVGYDAVDVAALTERGIPLTIAVDGNAVSVAEHTLMMMLALARGTFAYDSATRAGDFDFRRKPRSHDLAGKALLIIGFGRIGSRVARRALAFEMDVHVYDPCLEHGPVRDAGCVALDDYRPRLGEMDVVTVHCPLTAETAGMIGREALAAMRPSAYLINTARGGIVDEQALYDALVQGRLAGAGLDVFALEPAPADCPLFGLDNVVVTPHCAGVTRESAVRLARGAAENVLAAFAGVLARGVVVNHEVLAGEHSASPRYHQ